MARRRTATRRRRTVATVISNPGRSRKARRKAPRVTRRNPRRSKRRKVKSRRKSSRRSTKRRRNPSRKSYHRKGAHSGRRTKSRRNPSRKHARSVRRRKHVSRRNPSRRTRTRSTMRRKSRRNPWKLSSKTRRGSKRTRRNPGIGKMFTKVPVIGGTLAAAFGSMPAGLIAGVAMEIPMRLSPFVASQSWIPAILKENEFAYFTRLSALSGAVTAGALKMAGISKIPFLGSVANLPGLMTAAGAGAGYVKMRSRQMANEIGIATPEQQVGGDEPVAGMGAIVASSTGGFGLISADMGMGPGFSVSPGGFAGASMGAVLVGS
jgi:hypothetical protein